MIRIISMLALFVLAFLSLSVRTEDCQDSPCTQAAEEKTVSIPMDKHTHTIMFTDSEGLQTTLKIMYSVSGEKTISVSNDRLSAQDKIYTASDTIVSAYSPSYHSSYFTVTNDFLSVISTSEAKYTLICRDGITVMTKYLRVQIIHSTLVVTSNI